VEMLIKGEQTRTDIAKELGISKETLINIVNNGFDSL